MPLSIDVTAADWLNYALAYNRIPFVHTISVDGISPDQPTTLTVEVYDQGLALTHPFMTELTPDADGRAALRSVPVQLDLAAMSQVDEDRRVELVVQVSDGIDVVEHRSDLMLGSARTWRMMPRTPFPGAEPTFHPLSIETLAAFVRPNDPVIAGFLAKVRTRLERTTGSSATPGYQVDAVRVDEVVRAIWDEARDSDIAYSDPPASWDSGQKVRTPQEVLEGRVGTCLDTAVVLAAAIEHVGLHPVLFLGRSHAFLGYWRTEEYGVKDVESLDGAAAAVDAGLLRILETTAVCGGRDSATFDADVHETTRGRYLVGDLNRLIGVVDIDVSRRQTGIIPLPARHVDASGAVTIVEYQPVRHSGHSPAPEATTDRPARTSVEDHRTPAPPRVQAWKNSLLDLSLRNKLLNFTQRSAIALTIPPGSLGHVEDLLNDGQALSLLPADQVPATHAAKGYLTGADIPATFLREILDSKRVFTDITTWGDHDVYLRRMRTLAYKARTIEEETGANNLYLAIGALRWEVNGRPVKSPLVLIPVTLVPSGRSGSYRLQLDEAGASTPNYCLVEKLRQEDGLVISELENPVEDESGIDLDATFRAVRDAVARRELPYRVEESADLAVLQFAKFRLWKDLDDDWEGLMAAPLVRHLVEDVTGEFTDPRADSPIGDLDELDALCPIPADASQLEAIGSAVAGQTFVLQGPPGTGKSQTITNLLARAVASGQRVLFVAEKRAALDVVSARLASIGMGPFSLDLHDKSSKPTVVRQQIKEALDLAIAVDEQGLSAERETVDSSRRTLQRYPTRLHEKNAAGLSLYSARRQVLAYPDDLPALPISIEELSRLTEDGLVRLRNTLRTIEDTAELADPQHHHPWGFIRGTVADPAVVLRAATRLDEADAAFGPGTMRSLLDLAVTQSDLDAVVSLISGPALTLDELDQVRTRSWAERRDAYVATLESTLSQPPPVLSRVRAEALDLPLRQVADAVKTAADSGFFGRKKRILAAMEPLDAHLVAPLKPKHATALLDELLTARAAADQLAPEVAGPQGLRPVPLWNPYRNESIEHVRGQIVWLEAQAQRLQPATHKADPFGEALRSFVAADVAVDESERSAIRAIATAARELWSASGITEVDLDGWSDGSPVLPLWSAGLPGRGTGLRAEQDLNRWLQFVEHASELRALGLEGAFEAVLEGRIASVSAVTSLDKGLAVASLEERLTVTGLDRFDPQSHDKVVQRFTRSMTSLREHLCQAVAADVLAARTFTSQTDRGQVGELKRQINRQRGGMKVRELLAHYGDLITQIMPCVLVSPDSVARFFPVGSLTFDIVVFDEASQIRVADAVGAMGRARSAVVVGDSKQMPPTSFGEPTDDTAAIEALLVEPDQESILTEVDQAGIKQLDLTWHYRSKDESLIAFSNERYYNDRLSSFPSPTAEVDELGRRTEGVSLVRVQGSFVRSSGPDRGTNRVEAEAIVDDIRRRFAESPHLTPSIGVVTFNMPQRTLVDTMLRDLEDPRITEALERKDGEGLFVKNLENVQGDERDVVLFSTAFSKNAKGVLPLNFGPLNNRGGERRLNVAITRARAQVVIYSSFDPSDLRVDATGSQGIKDLAAYLTMAAGRSAGIEPAARNPVRDRHRDQIASALRQAGLEVSTDIGLSDFKIDLALAPAGSDSPVVAVLLDGEGWAARRTVGDRDGLPVAVLENLMGWELVERVWLPEWLADPDEVVERLVAAVGLAVEEAARQPVEQRIEPARAAAPQLVSPAPSSPSLRSMPSPTASRSTDYALPGSTPFVPWKERSLGSRQYLDALPSKLATEKVRAAILEVVAAEGPIAEERLARLVAGAFDLTRLNAARIQSILRCVPPSMRDGNGFVWPDSLDRSTWTEFRTATADSPRPVADVSPQEMANAIVALCRDAHGMTEDELYRETLALFGWKRRTEAMLAPVRAGLDSALSSQRLVRRPDDVLTSAAGY